MSKKKKLFNYIMFDTKLYNNRLCNSFNIIKGLGEVRINYIISLLGIAGDLWLVSLNDYYFNILKHLFSRFYLLEDRLDLWLSRHKSRYILLNSFRGFRRSKGLPVRGQRTCSNAETARRLKK